MADIDFFKGLNFEDLATVTEDGDLLRGGKSTIQIIEDSNSESHIPERYKTVRFSDYGNTLEMTDESVIREYKEFCLDKDSDKIFGLSGPTGSGKTTLVCCGPHERAVNGLPSGTFISCRFLKPMIMTSRSFKAIKSEEDIYRELTTCPFLILDEVGKCTDEQLEWEFFTTVVAGRYDNKLPMAFTTSFDYSQLRQFVLNNENKGADIYDRIKSVLIAKTLLTESYRTRS